VNEARYIAGRFKKHLAYLAVLAKVIGESYERTTNPRDRVRLSEVAFHVAERRDVAVSTPLRRDVQKAARLLGFTRIVTVEHVRYYQGMRSR
jgi:hypothetical protein